MKNSSHRYDITRPRTRHGYKYTNNKQIFHANLLNIILPRVSNFNIKQKKAWNICFIICHQHQTRSGKIKSNKA